MAKRSGFEIEVRHRGLKKYRLIRGHDRRDAQARAEAQYAIWEEQWQKKCAAEAKKTAKAERAARHRAEKWGAQKRTEDAQRVLKSLAETLTAGLAAAGPLDWESYRPNAPFQKSPPYEPTIEEPDPASEKYQPWHGWFDWLKPGGKKKKEEEARARFAADFERWKTTTERFEAALASWKAEEASFLADQAAKRQELDELRSRYLRGEPDALQKHADMVLTRSDYPDFMPKAWRLLFVPETGILLVVSLSS